jgi:hypothetical protein
MQKLDVLLSFSSLSLTVPLPPTGDLALANEITNYAA